MMSNTSTNPSLQVETKAASAVKEGAEDVSPTAVNDLVVVVDAETRHLEAGRRLKYIISNISAPFCCSGTLELEHAVAVTVDDKTVTIQPPDAPPNQKAYGGNMNKTQLEQQGDALGVLLTKTPLAVFGKGSETVYDASIRSAKQLQVESFSVNIEPDGTHLKGILQRIQVALQLQTEIVAEPTHSTCTRRAESLPNTRTHHGART
jgi:hypothetical protein